MPDCGGPFYTPNGVIKQGKPAEVTPGMYNKLVTMDDFCTYDNLIVMVMFSGWMNLLAFIHLTFWLICSLEFGNFYSLSAGLL